MRILVIGGAGYIGSHVVGALLDSGYKVSVYDNLSTGCRENLFKEAEFFHGDIQDEIAIDRVMQSGFDGIIHLAALKAAGESMQAVDRYSKNNITGTLNILNAAVRCGVPICIFSSSAAVYGSPRYLPIDEAHPTEPENYYGFTKLEIERFLSWYSKLKGLRFCALRYFNAAGYDPTGRIRGLERNPANLLPIIMEVAVGIRKEVQVYGNDYDTRDGTGLRDYIHVNDLAQAHVKALEYVARTGNDLTVNLGSQQGITVLEMLDQARQITKKTIPAVIVQRRAGDPATVLASSKQAYDILSWKPECSDSQTLIRSAWEIYKSVYCL